MVAHAQAPTQTERPASLPLPAIDALPAELRARPQWVAVRLVPKGDGKLDKVPVDPAGGRNADAGNPATWGTVEAAHALARRRGLGIGYVFSEDDPFTGVDKDGCRDPRTGELTPDAFILLGRLATYAEASISGKGIHAIARATKPGPRCRRRRGDLELYDRLRLFAFSGAHLTGTPRAVMDRQAEVAALYEDEFGEPEPIGPRPAPRPVATDDATLIERARAARDEGRFDRLWRGDDADHGGNESDADYHFCRSAAFWTGGDAARIDAWYRASGRTRPKWDERRGTTTYGAMTIKAALERQRTFYDPERREDDGCTLTLAAPPLGGGVSKLDTPPECAEWRGRAERAEARLRAIHELMTCPGMTPVERVIAYGVVNEEASARSRGLVGEYKPGATTVRPSVVSETLHVGRQTVGATLKRWDKCGYIKAETVDAGDGNSATVIELPATDQLENLRLAKTWARPEGAPKHGGNQGNRCPKCNSGERKKEVERETIETTTISCAACGEIHSVTKRRVGETRTLVSFEDAARWADDDEDEGGVSNLDTPPLERTQGTDETVTVDETTTTVRDAIGARRAGGGGGCPSWTPPPGRCDGHGGLRRLRGELLRDRGRAAPVQRVQGRARLAATARAGLRGGGLDGRPV